MKLKKAVNVILVAIIAVGVFSFLVLILKTSVLPLLPEYFRTWITAYVGAGLLTITIFAGFAQITGYSLKDFAHKNENVHSIDLSQVDGTHKAKGEGEITGLDIQGPVIIKPGTKSIAEGKGKITATRISNSREEK